MSEWDKVLAATEGHNIESIVVQLNEGKSSTYILCTCGTESFREPSELTDHIRRLVFDALIPEGAVLVTQETLVRTLTVLDPDTGQDDWQLMHVSQGDDYAKSRREWAAAILRHLREGT